MKHELEFEFEASLEGEYCTKVIVLVEFSVDSEVDYCVESITLWAEHNEVDIALLPPNEQKQIERWADDAVAERCHDVWVEQCWGGY